jgi:CubicO group peptidase (beta-lactamase class C family)
VTSRLDPVATFVRGEIDAGAAPAAVWWVGGPGGPRRHGAYGHAAIEPAVEIVAEATPFDLASLTKPLATALLAVLLERERRLSLVATLGSILPALRASPWGGATLRDAAAHRTGLPAWKPLYLEGSTREDYMRAIAALPASDSAGATLYSDLGYLLLGFALEHVMGASLDQLFDERVAHPLRLARTGFPGRGDAFADAAATERGNTYERKLAGDPARDGFRRDVIRGHVHDGNAWGLGGVAGHAGLFGTAADVARIAIAILEPARLGRPRGATDAMLHPVGGQGTRTIGFVPARDTESVRGILPDDAVGHYGFTGTSVWIDPHAARVYVLLTNRVHPVVPDRDFVSTRRGFHSVAAGNAPGR